MKFFGFTVYFILAALVVGLIVLAGCRPQLPAHDEQTAAGQFAVQVVDAETNQPIQGAVVAAHYFPSSPQSPAPNFPKATTDGTGKTSLAVAAKLCLWHIQAEGYISQTQTGAPDCHPPYRYTGADPKATGSAVVHLYRQPEPQLTVRVSDAYTGPLTINLVPAAGFAFVAPDGMNRVFAPVKNDADYTQGSQGQRTFTETVPSTATVTATVTANMTATAGVTIDLNVTPLLYDITTEQLRVVDGSGVLPMNPTGDLQKPGRWVWGTANDNDKQLSGQIRLFIGSAADYGVYQNVTHQ
ncbi:MAG: hypothetical protein NT075_00895 [Chloroflexi bacterium]|nr:hypothetical protein [Chloroflexota bacterium]